MKTAKEEFSGNLFLTLRDSCPYQLQVKKKEMISQAN